MSDKGRAWLKDTVGMKSGQIKSLEEPFLWLPSLEGPTPDYTQGVKWLTEGWSNGAPALGWHDTLCYLVLPVLLVASQYISTSILTPKPTDESQQQNQAILKFLPLMIGWFSLNVPSGLSLYYFTNTVTVISQQIYLRKLGGAQAPEFDLPEVTRLGAARKTGSLTDVAPDQAVVLEAEAAVDSEDFEKTRELEAAVAVVTSSQFASDDGFDRRCKRRRRARGTPASMIEDGDNGPPDLGIEIVAN